MQMRYKQIAILLAAAVSINTAAPVAAEAADSVAAEAQTPEPVSETMPPEEEADEQTGQQEALYEETLEDTPISEETVAESHSSFSTDKDPEKDSPNLVDADGLIEDDGNMVSDARPGEPETIPEETETETEDIHRGMFPGFVVDPSRYPAANITENTLILYCFLREEMELNHAAACGILANVHLESNFRPIALGDGGTSYGICQWHNGRFSHLMAYCRREGLDYNMLDGQLEFLRYELEHGYRKAYEAVREVTDDEDGAYQAAYEFCMRFEKPDQIVARSERRGNLSRNEYYDKDFKELAETFEENERIQDFFGKELPVRKRAASHNLIETEVM